MGLISNYNFQGEVINDAYFRIKKIVLAKADDETFVDGEDGHSYAQIETINENMAYVFVYNDHGTRTHNARPLNQFGIMFDWADNGQSPFAAAYEALKKTKNIVEYGFQDVLEDVSDEEE